MVQLQPHLVLVDAALIRCTDVVVRISNLETGARIVAFAVAEEDDREVLACAEAGVAGFVGRDASVNDLVVALHTALRGEVRCSPRVAGLMMRRIAAYSDLGPFAYDRSRLTRREIEIVELIDVGLSNKEIACRLGIETATVKNHVHNLLEKLRVHRRGEAAAAVRVGRRGPTMRPGLDHPT
jgi:DNA-binding NarL/FixJ family response regulator